MKDNLRKVLIVIFTLIAIGCAGYLFWYYSGDKVTDKELEEVKTPVEVEEEDQVVETEEEDPVVIPVDFEKLQETNSDVYAWISIDGTVIDYPIVQNDDPEYYLNRNWKGEWASEGAIFTQDYNDKDFSDFNTVIYGHQMGAGVETMFHQLGKYLDKEFMNEHREIVIYTPEHIYTYKVYAAVVYDDRHLMYAFNQVSEDGRKAFIDSFLNANDMRNQYCDDISVSSDDRLITLSTCVMGESDRRLLIGAVLVDEK